MLGGVPITLSDTVTGEPRLKETPFVLRTDIGEEMGLGPDRPILRFRCGLPPTTGDFWGGVRGGFFDATFVKDGVEEVDTALLVAKGLLLEP